MTKPKIVLALNDTEFVRPLRDGTVQVNGADIVLVTHMQTPEIVERMNRGEFDGAEMGLNFAVTAAARNMPEGLISLPIFPLRRFCHSTIFINTSAGITRPQDLVGRRIGNVFPAAGNVWTRGILQEHYGVPYRDVKWASIDWELQSLTPPWHERVKDGRAMEEMLRTGQLDAVIRSHIAPGAVFGDVRIAYLFPNHQGEETAYFRKTGILPILHSLVFKQSVIEKFPWLSQSLVRAFEDSRAIALRRAIDPRIVFARSVAEQQTELLGTDPWTNGLTSHNRAVIATFIRYAFEQEMIQQTVSVESLFADG